MTTIAEELGESTQLPAEEISTAADGPATESIPPAARRSGRSLLDAILAPSSAESLDSDELANHPLNPTATRGGARFARGLDAMFGGLRLALVDVVLGAVQMVVERIRVPRKGGAGNGQA